MPLRKAGAASVKVVLAGSAQPLTDPGRRGASARNARVEVVFVAPAS